MGAGSWNPSSYSSFASSTVGKRTEEIYTSRSADAVLNGPAKHLNPHGVVMRESRDSDINPQSTPIIVDIDVTGSMGMLADTIAREGLGTLFEEILNRKPVTDPHLMFMANGDANYDDVPLQVSQFEADDRIIKQLTDIYIEHGGGGNSFESYNLPWYFAAMHTSIDSMEKRGKKGYLFTIGDEEVPAMLTVEQIKKFIGDDVERAYSNDELLTMVGRLYHVFHLVVEEGSHVRHRGKQVHDGWAKVMGQHALRLKDHTKLAEVIVSAIQVNEGADTDAVVGSWKGGTDVVVAHAVKGLTPYRGSAPGVATL